MNSLERFNSNFKKFIVENGIVGAVAGVCVGIATKDVINSLVGDIIIPFCVIGFYKVHLKQFTKLLPGRGAFDFISFIKHFITWIVVLVITYIFLKTTFENFLGVPLKKHVDEKPSKNQTRTQIQGVTI
jgi:large-conductance mechanosensitive channel